MNTPQAHHQELLARTIGDLLVATTKMVPPDMLQKDALLTFLEEVASVNNQKLPDSWQAMRQVFAANLKHCLTKIEAAMAKDADNPVEVAETKPKTFVTEVWVADPEAVVKEAFWLAWQACGSPLGMGMFQNNPTATKEQVWDNAYRAGDYPGGLPAQGNKPGNIHGDYVFGRMMKLGLKWDAFKVILPDYLPRRDYQAWCVKYPTYEALIDAAIKSLGVVSTQKERSAP